ncbi:MAG: leucine-rich repeat domain-containing protein [Chloroflexota bacterium]
MLIQHHKKIWFGLLILIVGLSFFMPKTYAAPVQQTSFDCPTVSEIPQTECEALVVFYNSTNGASWTDNSGWLQNATPCGWVGIVCNNGNITQLLLEGNNLSGMLPPELGMLTMLNWLQLNNNQLQGSIPAELGMLTQVTWLRLEDNELSGEIPASLEGLTTVQSLYLAGNNLDGSIPAELGNLPNLNKLYLSENNLSGSIPAELGNLATLTFLTLNGTHLSGSLPLSFTNLTNLQFFHFLNTNLCEPTDVVFQAWIDGVPDVFSTDVTCSDNPTPTATIVVPTPTATAVSTPPTPTATPSADTDPYASLVTDRNPRPMTPLAKPALGQAVVDPEFGTTIRRITNIDTVVPNGQGVMKPMYNTVQAWNADESYLILYQVGDGHHLYNGLTYEYIRPLDINPADLEEVFWHFTNPDILFFISNSNQSLIRYRVSNDNRETLRSFGNICGNAGVESGNDVQMMSWDSDVIGLRCTDEPAQLFGYRISTDTLTPILTSGQGNSYDPWYAPQAAPSGNLFLLDYDVLDSNLNFLRRLNISSVEHASLGQLANGNDGLFTVAFADGPNGGCGNGALVVHDLTNGNCQTVVGEATGYPYPPSGTHMSALSPQKPGWVAVSMVGVANGGETGQVGQALLDNELLLVNTAANGAVYRVGHHRSFGRGGPQGYWAEPHVVLSPSGTRLLFGSDWMGGDSVDSYVIELPDSDGDPIDPPPPPNLQSRLYLPLIVKQANMINHAAWAPLQAFWVNIRSLFN